MAKNTSQSAVGLPWTRKAGGSNGTLKHGALERALTCTTVRVSRLKTHLAPNHSLEQTRPRRRDTLKGSWPGRSARGR